jgi:hypothetical protein
MVGRSLHRQGILDCVAELDQLRQVVAQSAWWFSLLPHGPRETSGHRLKRGADEPRRASFRETPPCGRVFHFRGY